MDKLQLLKWKAGASPQDGESLPERVRTDAYEEIEYRLQQARGILFMKSLGETANDFGELGVAVNDAVCDLLEEIGDWLNALRECSAVPDRPKLASA